MAQAKMGITMIWGVRRALYEIVPKQNGLF
jgi:hypothetical protein